MIDECFYLIEFGFCMYYGDDCEDHPTCDLMEEEVEGE